MRSRKIVALIQATGMYRARGLFGALWQHNAVEVCPVFWDSPEGMDLIGQISPSLLPTFPFLVVCEEDDNRRREVVWVSSQEDPVAKQLTRAVAIREGNDRSLGITPTPHHEAAMVASTTEEWEPPQGGVRDGDPETMSVIR